MFIKLTNPDNTPLILNSNAARTIEVCNESSPHFQKGIRSFVMFNSEEFYAVKETVEEIWRMINN